MHLEILVRNIIARTFNVPHKKVTISARLREDLDGNELDVAEVVYELAEKLGKPVRQIMSGKLRNVEDLYQYAARYFGISNN